MSDSSRKAATPPRVPKRGATRIFAYLRSIKGKILVLVLIPVIALIILLVSGSWSLKELSNETDRLVNNEFAPLIDKDFADIEKMRADIGVKRASIKEMLEADRDLHQAYIAEQAIQIVSTPEERRAANDTIEENMEQAQTRINRAAEQLDTPKGLELYEQFKPAFEVWVTEVREIAEAAMSGGGASAPETEAGQGDSGAESASPGQPSRKSLSSSKESFDIMRDLVDQMQLDFDDRIAEIDAAIESKGNEIENKKGEIQGAVKQAKDDADRSILQFGLVATIAVAASIILGFIIALGVSRGLNRTVYMIKDIAQGEGDLTQRLQASGGSELEELARWFNVFVEKLQGIIGEIASNAETLSQATDLLSNTASQMQGSADSMTAQASTSAAATEEASANMKSVASAITEISASSTTVADSSDNISSNLNSIGSSVEETSANMNTIASAVTEMSTSIETIAASIEELSATQREVATSSSEAAGITSDAAKMAASTLETVRSLGKSAEEIGNVVAVISGIASQTNLLALNATIEAASAGEQGKGFAVVANEVKELAKRTAGSTEEIRTQVENIQRCTHDTVAAIDSISGIIGQIDKIAGTIASRVEEQSTATNNISSNFAEVAAGAGEISSRVEETARGTMEVSGNLSHALNDVTAISRHMNELANATQEIARNASEAEAGMNEVAVSVTKISDSAKDTADGAAATRDSSVQLAELATHQKGLVSQFRV